MKKVKLTIGILILVILMAAGWLIWQKTASKTKVALVNFQKFQTTSLIQSNKDKFIEFKEVSFDNLDELKNYDFVLGFAMGMKLDAEQRERLKKMMKEGTHMYLYSATNPENNLCNLDSIQKEEIDLYLKNGNKKNYQSLARYIRQNIDQKRFFVTPPDKLVELAEDVYYHLDEYLSFKTINEYESYLKKNNFFKENANKIAIIGGLNDPYSGNRENLDSLIVKLQNKGFNVYPVSSTFDRLKFLKEIQPDAVIHFAHGRLVVGQADSVVGWLKERNIPVFVPVTILQTKNEWIKDPMGLMGGFLSQSVVMPEIDGGIYPYVLNTQELDKDNLYVFKAVPERLNNFTQIITNFINLKKKNNSDKKIAIYFFKGPGKESLVAQGLETIPSLYNLLKRLKAEGYKVEDLPATEKEFEKIVMSQGSVMSTYAEGAFDEFLKNGNPELIEKSVYESWVNQSLTKEKYKEVTDLYGQALGNYMNVSQNGKSYIAVSRVQFGNIVLLPQPMAGLGGDSFAIVHGAKSPPPHTYIGSYLWTQYGFKADALIHFGTHGSLEFTPQKQIALSNEDWPDRMVGTVPHFYYYTIANIGESMMAKRRSYATLISYLSPAFMESQTRSQFKDLQNKIQYYYKSEESKQPQVSLEVKKIAVQMGIHRDLRLDSILTKPYTTEEVEKIENFSEEIANEKMNGQLYTSGVPYTSDKINSSVLAMSADPIAYSLAALDKQRSKVTEQQLKNKVFFSQKYLNPSKELVKQILSGKVINNSTICSIAGINEKELEEAKIIMTPVKRTFTRSPKKSETGKGKSPHSEAMKPSGKDVKPSHPKKVEYTKEQKIKARSILEIERTITNILNYKEGLEKSPEYEFRSLLNALSGGYIEPSSGGDAVANPNAVPTGRNLYSINAEATPTEIAWDRAKELVNQTLGQYVAKHGKYPKKVSYTFWSGEFIESEGTTIAQALYMLGVEPVRDAFGRVSDIQLIPSETLGRPRIDVVVQTSGQFRDLAASRLVLLSRAIEMASTAKDTRYENLVAKGTLDIEKTLVEQGVSPKDARQLSTQRIFGGINGMYGASIQEMVKSGDKWEDKNEIADTYINNMGAIYASDKDWGQFHKGLLRAALKNTDMVIQPRQNNTWGALSLDHVYEFMGGVNLAVKSVTGKEPDAFFADYRNHNNFKMQDLKEAIGVEARSTIFNEVYIKERMKGGASSAANFTEIITNTYGWNVMKPEVIDNEMWNQIYSTYVKDEKNLGTKEFFKNSSPAALEEITAIMLETARKGMWKASEDQLKQTALLHTEIVKEFGHSGSGFSGSNTKLQNFITTKVNKEQADQYKKNLAAMEKGVDAGSNNKDAMVLKKDEIRKGGESITGKKSFNGLIIVSIVAVLVILIILFIVKRRKKHQDNQ
ncbi:cobaltochelatase subunit CobN [Apibacter raozihei]|uniref:cobaltochelatase subunit CobN n=1 Tax=Apibacter raozihei TaxID=2500547 RepID=UPI000FE35888|nr:cobaltochelatase subunit CobN [Apibacter raozihei]